MPAQPRIILASASPRRRELLATLGLAFEVVPSNVDESIEERDPRAAAELLARRKAEAVAAEHPDALVIGSDTIVALDGHMLGKPEDAEEARTMLRGLRGRPHQVVTGVAAILGGREESSRAWTTVHMRPYPDDAIEAFIATGSPFDKAGGYAIQDEAFAPVERFEGCRCAVIGLPLGLLRTLLARFGIETRQPDVECPVCGSDA